MNRHIKSVFLALLLSFSLLLGPSALAASSPDKTFQDANALYFQGQWEEARKTYASLLDSGIKDPVLYHNLGNASFREGKLGWAVFYYLKAESLKPKAEILDSVEKNLEATRRTLQARYKTSDDRALVYHSNKSFLYQVSHVVDALPLSLAFLLLWLLLFVSLSLKRLHMAPNWSGRAAIFSASFALVFGLLLLGQALTSGDKERAVVIASDALIRDGRHELAQGSHLPEGIEVNILDESEDWTHVELGNGKRGWTKNTKLETL